jgi:hypothetical protein
VQTAARDQAFAVSLLWSGLSAIILISSIVGDGVANVTR